MNPWRLLESVWMLVIIGIIVLAVMVVTGCAAPAKCIKPIVSIERPVLPTISASELQPLADDVYLRLISRDRLLHEYAETLEVIVRETAEVTP